MHVTCSAAAVRSGAHGISEVGLEQRTAGVCRRERGEQRGALGLQAGRGADRTGTLPSGTATNRALP